MFGRIKCGHHNKAMDVFLEIGQMYGGVSVCLLSNGRAALLMMLMSIPAKKTLTPTFIFLLKYQLR